MYAGIILWVLYKILDDQADFAAFVEINMIIYQKTFLLILSIKKD